MEGGVCQDELDDFAQCVNVDASCTLCFDPVTIKDTWPEQAEGLFRASLAFASPTDPDFCTESNWRVCKKFYPLENGEAVSDIVAIIAGSEVGWIPRLLKNKCCCCYVWVLYHDSPVAAYENPKHTSSAAFRAGGWKNMVFLIQPVSTTAVKCLTAWRGL